MGQRGPKPQPTELGLVEGSRRAVERARAGTQPRGRMARPRPSKRLTKSQQKIFREQVKRIESLLGQCPGEWGPAIELYAVARDDCDRAEELTSKVSPVVASKTADGRVSVQVNQLFYLTMGLRKQLRSLLADFGMTPADGVGVVGSRAESPAAALRAYRESKAS